MMCNIILTLVFTSKRRAIRSGENQNRRSRKQIADSAYDSGSIAYDQVKSALSESQAAEAEE